LVVAEGDSWSVLASMPTARSGLGVIAIDGKIYAIGGYNGSYVAVNEMYDPEADTWITMNPMPTPRSNFGVCVYHDMIYVFGGIFRTNYGDQSGYTNVTEIYDPATDTWSTGASEPTSGRAHLCANVVGDSIYLVSGTSYILLPPSFHQSSTTNLVYSPSNDSWSTKTSIPTDTAYYSSTVVDNQIYFIGGKFVKNNCPQIYEPETDTWTYGTGIVTAIYSAVAGATSGEMAPTRIYILGGTYNASNTAGNLTYVYDPETDIWATGTPMPTPRYGLGVAVVTDELYVIGGKNETTFLATTEKYTPTGYIPEFSSWVVFPVFLVVTLLVTVCKRKLQKTPNQLSNCSKT
jgi:N-acetylneuraminic acid mutarotase